MKINSRTPTAQSPSIFTHHLSTALLLLMLLPLNGPFPGLPRWAVTRKVKPIWILLKQETVSGSGIIWAICKSASRSRQITTPAPHHSVFYGRDALPVAQPTASKHWRHSTEGMSNMSLMVIFVFSRTAHWHIMHATVKLQESELSTSLLLIMAFSSTAQQWSLLIMRFRDSHISMSISCKSAKLKKSTSDWLKSHVWFLCFYLSQGSA